MVKKTAKTAKPNIQRTREEQWRRRVAAQGGIVASGATMDSAEMGAPSDGAEATYASEASTASRTASTMRSGAATRNRAASSASSTMQRRTVQSARPGRLKMATQAMSMDEEMDYVKSDIRRLIILTAVCLAVLIALSFFIR